MPRISTDDKKAKLDRIYQVIRSSGIDGIKVSEIEDLLNIHQRTIREYVEVLESEGKVYREGWYLFADPDYRPITLRRLEVEAEEAMVLYLATRLFVKQSDKRTLTAELMLTKLADMLTTDAGLKSDILDAANELVNRPKKQGYEDIFRRIMRGYLQRCPIEIVYHPYKGTPFQTIIHPYLIEPSAIGYATYVIGHSSNVDALRTYKIERIESAKLLHGDGYTVPDEFNGLELLNSAWSIYYGDELVDVTLRFHPNVARRVRETNWHPSQSPIEDDPENEGYVLLQFQVADTTDLVPWIRTWGANCEVLEPQILRDELIGEARRFAELYGWQLGGFAQNFSDLF